MPVLRCTSTRLCARARNTHTYPVQSKAEGPRVSPWVIAFFVFVVVGSALFQIIDSATSKKLVGN
ncbi:hypothetical protein EON67_05350 [archaeon]|nr:MAG: hypothetical protein EON67_05350 [archaeon]